MPIPPCNRGVPFAIENPVLREEESFAYQREKQGVDATIKFEHILIDAIEIKPSFIDHKIASVMLSGDRSIDGVEAMEKERRA
jgi:hypothetical protein